MMKNRPKKLDSSSWHALRKVNHLKWLVLCVLARAIEEKYGKLQAVVLKGMAPFFLEAAKRMNRSIDYEDEADCRPPGGGDHSPNTQSL